MTVGPNLLNWILHPDVTKNVISCLVMEDIFMFEARWDRGLRNDSGLYIEELKTT